MEFETMEPNYAAMQSIIESNLKDVREVMEHINNDEDSDSLELADWEINIIRGCLFDKINTINQSIEEIKTYLAAKEQNDGE